MMFFNLGFSACFLMIKLGLWVLEGRPQRKSTILISSDQRYLLSACLIITDGIKLGHLAEVQFARFLHCKFIVFLP